MTREEYIESIVSQIDDKAAREEFRHEIEARLDDRIAFYTDAGYDYDYALDKAIGRMGDTATVGAQMNNLYDTTKVNRLIWVMTVLDVVLALVSLFGPTVRENYLFFDFGGTAFHTEIFVFAIGFMLAAKHKTYKPLMIMSISNLAAVGLLLTVTFGEVDSQFFVSPLCGFCAFVFQNNPKIESITADAFFVTAIIACLYYLFASMLGVLQAAQIKLVVTGRAKTNLLKRFSFTKYFNIAVLVSELAPAVVFVYCLFRSW